MAIAVVSIASSAVLVEVAAASAVALAFWRCLGGALLLAPAAARSGISLAQLRRCQVPLLLGGLSLGLHFATWLASLERTSTAASVTLVTTAPVFVVAGTWLTGRRPSSRTLVAVAIAVVGAVVLTGGDLIRNPGSVDGDLLALTGAVCMAVYLLVGDRLRSDLGTASYAAPVYAIAAAALIPIAFVGGVALTGFDSHTWLAVGAMIIGPQIGGHTVLNHLLGRIGSVLVSMILLAEPIVASLLTWIFFGEVPPSTAWIGAPIVLLGMGLAITATQSARGQPTMVSPRR